MNALATEYRLGHLDFKPNSADDVRFLPESASKTKLQKLSKEGDEAFLVGVTSVIGAFGLGSIAGVLLVLIVIRNLFRRNSGLIPRH